MPFSPADYDLWARSTGRKYPSTPAERAAVASEVNDFLRGFGKGTPNPNASRVGGNVVYDQPVSVKNYDDNSVLQSPVTPDNNVPKVAGVNNNTLTGEQFENQNQDNLKDNARRDAILRTLGKVAAGAGLVAGSIALARTPMGRQVLETAGGAAGQGYQKVSNRVSDFLGGFGVKRSTDLDTVAASGDVTPPTTAQQFNQQAVSDQTQAVQQARGAQVGTPEKNLVPTVSNTYEDPWYSNVKPVTETEKLATSQSFRPAGSALDTPKPVPLLSPARSLVERNPEVFNKILAERPIVGNEPEYKPTITERGDLYGPSYEIAFKNLPPHAREGREAALRDRALLQAEQQQEQLTIPGISPAEYQIKGKYAPKVDIQTGEILDTSTIPAYNAPVSDPWSTPGATQLSIPRPAGVAIEAGRPLLAAAQSDVVEDILAKFRPDYESAKRLETGRQTQAEMRRQQSVVDQVDSFMDRVISDIRSEPAVGVSEQTSELNPVADVLSRGARSYGSGGEPTRSGIPYSILAGQSEKRDVIPSFYNLEGRTNKIVNLPSAENVIPNPATAFTSSSDILQDAWQKAYGLSNPFEEAYKAGTERFLERERTLPKERLTISEGGQMPETVDRNKLAEEQSILSKATDFLTGQSGGTKTWNFSNISPEAAARRNERMNQLVSEANLEVDYPNRSDYDLSDKRQEKAYKDAELNFYKKKAQQTALELYKSTGDPEALRHLEEGALPLNVKVAGGISVPTRELFTAFGERINPTTGIASVDKAEESMLAAEKLRSLVRGKVTEQARAATENPSIIWPTGSDIKSISNKPEKVFLTDAMLLSSRPTLTDNYTTQITSPLSRALGALTTVNQSVQDAQQRFATQRLFPYSYGLNEAGKLGTYLTPSGYYGDPTQPGGANIAGVRLATEQEDIPTQKLYDLRARSSIGRQQFGNVGRLLDKAKDMSGDLPFLEVSQESLEPGKVFKDVDSGEIVTPEDMNPASLEFGIRTGKLRAVSGVSTEPQRILQGGYGRTFKGVSPDVIDPLSFTEQGRALLKEAAPERYDPETGLYYSRLAMQKPTGESKFTTKYDPNTETILKYNERGQLTGVEKARINPEGIKLMEEVRKGVMTGNMPSETAYALQQNMPVSQAKTVNVPPTRHEQFALSAAAEARNREKNVEKTEKAARDVRDEKRRALNNYIQRSLPGLAYESRLSPADIEASQLGAYMAQKAAPMIQGIRPSAESTIYEQPALFSGIKRKRSYT